MARKEDGNDLPTATSDDGGAVDAMACPVVANGPGGCFHAPPDLMAFVRDRTVTEVARALGMSRRTAHRLRDGYWPRDTRGILAYWEAYKGRTASQQSRWFLRRVQAGGLVLHAGAAFSAPGVDQREGQTLAVARSTAGLLAQTLELPSARFELLPAHAQA